jgi:hypothetical protein
MVPPPQAGYQGQRWSLDVRPQVELEVILMKIMKMMIMTVLPRRRGAKVSRERQL